MYSFIQPLCGTVGDFLPNNLYIYIYEYIFIFMHFYPSSHLSMLSYLQLCLWKGIIIVITLAFFHVESIY